jgi:hypothetical protein
MQLKNDEIYGISEWCYQNMSGDSLIAKKMSALIIKDNRQQIPIEKNSIKKYLDNCHVENMDFKSGAEENCSIKFKSAPVVVVFLCNNDEVKHGINKAIKYVKNGGLFVLVLNSNLSSSNKIKEMIGSHHGEVGVNIKMYMIDPIRRANKKNKLN